MRVNVINTTCIALHVLVKGYFVYTRVKSFAKTRWIFIPINYSIIFVKLFKSI